MGKTHKLQFRLRKLIIIITLLILSISTSGSIVNAADNPTVDNAKTSQLFNVSANSAQTRSVSVSDFTSPFNTKNQADINQTTYSVVSPLVVSETDYSTVGAPSSSGDYLKADVSYLLSTSLNDTDSVLRTTTITAYHRDGTPVGGLNSNGVTNGITTWALHSRPEDDTPLEIKQKIGGKGGSVTTKGSIAQDKLTSNGDSATLISGSRPAGSLPDVAYTSMSSFPIKVDAWITYTSSSNTGSEHMSISIDSGGGLSVDPDSVYYFDNTRAHFTVKKEVEDKVATDLLNYVKATVNKPQDITETLTWNIQSKGKALKKQVYNVLDEVNSFSSGDDDTDISSKDDPYTFSPLVFENVDNNANSMTPTYVWVEVTVNYKYKDFLLTKSGSKTVRLDGFRVEPAITPTDPDYIPKVDISNEIHDLTNPDNDDSSSEIPYLNIVNAKNGDELQYIAKLTIDFDSGQSDGIINNAEYVVPISNGVDVDKTSVAINGPETIEIDPDDVTVTTDPENPNQQLLKISNINFPSEEDSGSTYKITFNANVSDDGQPKFIFQPTFSGVGGKNGDQDLMVNATGQEQSISFANTTTTPSGDISLKPMDIDFGTINSFAPKNSLKHRANSSDSTILDVNDSRADKTSQVITLQEDQDLTSDLARFPGELRFYNPTDTGNTYSTLSPNVPIPIYTSNNGEQINSIIWPYEKGLLLHVNGGNAIPKGKYSTTLTWSVQDTIPNS